MIKEPWRKGGTVIERISCTEITVATCSYQWHAQNSPIQHGQLASEKLSFRDFHSTQGCLRGTRTSRHSKLQKLAQGTTHFSNANESELLHMGAKLR